MSPVELLKKPSLGEQSQVEQAAELNSFAEFLRVFPLQGENLYSTLFDQHSEIIQTQKPKFALANLEKILQATFEISSVSGFDRMSLRDLSKKTGMSMGAIYSCISKKEDIALMVANIVRHSSQLTQRHAMQFDSVWTQIEQSLRFHLYASTLLQPWYFFLYFETRSLPEDQQQASTKIELDAIQILQQLIEQGVELGEFQTEDAAMVANTVVVLLEDWYLKPWKTQPLKPSRQTLDGQESKLTDYYQSLIQLVRKLLSAGSN